MAMLTVEIAMQQVFNQRIQRVPNKNVLMLWGLFMYLTGCSSFNNTIIKIPIALHQAGSVTEADFNIAQDDRITLRLRFFVNDQGHRDRLLVFLDSPEKNRIFVPLKIQITQHIGSKNVSILERIYSVPGAFGVAENFFDIKIDDLTIKSGKYRIRLETINAFPQLSDTKVEFGVYYIRAPIM